MLSLSTWNERSAVQRRLELGGYFVHQAFQGAIRAIAKEKGLNSAEMDFYWDELSREWVSGAGRVNIESREFFGGDGYRSVYLDELASAREQEGGRRTWPLHPCEIAFGQRVNADADYGQGLTAAAEEIKLRMLGKGIPTISRELRSAGLRKELFAILAGPGFKASGVEAKLVTQHGLKASVGLESSRSASIFQLPVYLRIDDGSKEGFTITNFNRIVPGFSYNGLIFSDYDLGYGLHAYSYLIGLILESMDEVARNVCSGTNGWL